MDVGRLFGRGISFPPRVRDGRVVWSEGEENIRDAIRVILMTEPGERVMLPEFGAGLGRFVSEPNTPATRFAITEQVTGALARWEPRIRVESVDAREDLTDPRAVTVTVVWRLVATGAQERVSLGVPVGG
jgi:phage baseplate assembly protein W